MEDDVKKYYYIARETIPGMLPFFFFLPFTQSNYSTPSWNSLTIPILCIYSTTPIELVATETNPRKFLLVAKGDVKSAAERLATYWMNRYVVFVWRD